MQRRPSYSHHRQILFAWASSHSMRTLSAAGQTSDITLSCTKKTRDIALSQQIAVIISSSGLEIRFFLKVSKTHTASLWRKYYITKVLLKGRLHIWIVGFNNGEIKQILGKVDVLLSITGQVDCLYNFFPFLDLKRSIHKHVWNWTIFCFWDPASRL